MNAQTPSCDKENPMFTTAARDMNYCDKSVLDTLISYSNRLMAPTTIPFNLLISGPQSMVTV